MTTTPIATDAHLDAAFAETAKSDAETDAEAAEAAQKAETRVSASAKRAAEKAAAKVYEKKAAGPVVPNAAAKQRAVAANLLPDAAMYQVQKRKGPDDPNPGKLTYDHRYTQEEFQKFGDPRAFIKHFLVPKYGGGEYEVTPTSAAGVVGATITYDLGDDDDMGQNGAVQADLREIKTKLGEHKESVFEKAAAEAMTQMMQSGDAGEMTMEKVMMYRMMGDMFAPKADPAIVALTAKVEAMAIPTLPSGPPPPDPNALSIRDLMQMQKDFNDSLVKMSEKQDARFDKVLETISKVQTKGDPLESVLGSMERLEMWKQKHAPRDEDGTGMAKAITTFAKTAGDMWRDFNAMEQAKAAQAAAAANPQPQPQGQPQAQLPAPPAPELVAIINRVKAAATDEDRVTAAYDTAVYFKTTYPEQEKDFNAFVNDCLSVADARAAKNVALVEQGKAGIRIRIGQLYDGLMQFGAIDQAVATAGLASWEVKMEEFCDVLRSQAKQQAAAPTGGAK
jgi:hypothetical protein